MRKALHFLFLTLSLSFVVGCASTDQTVSTKRDLDPNGQPVSTVPWGRPEKWESGGQLGTAMGGN